MKIWHVINKIVLGLIGLTLFAGCATLAGPTLTTERYLACPQEMVWEGALEALKDYPVTVKNKEEGIIETDWKIQPVQGRPYGLFGRQNMGDKERSQFTFSMKPLQEGVVAISLTERRHHWGFVGGARLYEWRPVEPSQESINKVLNQLTSRLDQEGCIIES